MENKKNVFRAYIWKECKEMLATMKMTILGCIVVSNLLQYLTIEEVMKANLDKKSCALQLGMIEMYLAVIIILFLGNTLINKFIYDERKNATIHFCLASGMDKLEIWGAKYLVTVITCEIVTLVSIIVNVLFVYIYYGMNITFNVLSGILVFITIPFVCYGILALVSVAYWYFPNMNAFGMIFPLVAYIGTWNLSLQLATKFANANLVIISVLVGAASILLALFLVNSIPKERIAAREFR